MIFLQEISDIISKTFNTSCSYPILIIPFQVATFLHSIQFEFKFHLKLSCT